MIKQPAEVPPARPSSAAIEREIRFSPLSMSKVYVVVAYAAKTQHVIAAAFSSEARATAFLKQAGVGRTKTGWRKGNSKYTIDRFTVDGHEALVVPPDDPDEECTG